MRSKVVKTLALALVLSGAGIALGQQPQEGKPAKKGAPMLMMEAMKAPPVKSKLEEMLAEALKNNPDIRVAAANLTLAEAELNRIRLQVTQKVLTLYHAIQSQQATVNYEQKQYDRTQGLLKDRAIDSTLVEERFAKLTAAKAKLEELQAQIPALLGKSPQAEASASAVRTSALLALRLIGQQQLRLIDQQHPEAVVVHSLLAAGVANPHKATGPMTERLRKALQTSVRVDYKDMTLPEVLKDLMKKAPGLSIRCSPRANYGNVSLYFEEPLPVSAVLQALEDDFNLRFIVRDYGILVPDPQAPPPGAMTIEEFLRQRPANPKNSPEDKSQGATNRQLQPVEGRVTTIEALDRVQIDLGVKDGVKVGDVVEIFRPVPKPIYLGTLVIVQSSARAAVGKPQGRLAAPIQVGDHVKSKNPRPMNQFQSHSKASKE